MLTWEAACVLGRLQARTARVNRLFSGIRRSLWSAFVVGISLPRRNRAVNRVRRFPDASLVAKILPFPESFRQVTVGCSEYRLCEPSNRTVWEQPFGHAESHFAEQRDLGPIFSQGLPKGNAQPLFVARNPATRRRGDIELVVEIATLLPNVWRSIDEEDTLPTVANHRIVAHTINNDAVRINLARAWQTWDL